MASFGEFKHAIEQARKPCGELLAAQVAGASKADCFLANDSSTA